MMDLNKINQMFEKSEIDKQIYFQEKLEAVLFYAGSEWGKPPTVEEFLSGLDAAGLKIVEK